MKKIMLAALLMLLLVMAVNVQATVSETYGKHDRAFYRDAIETFLLTVDSTVTINDDVTITGALASGTIAGRCLTEAVTAETETVAAAESGKVYVQTRTSTTVTFTLPTPTAGQTFTFVCGNAGSEILINPGTGKAIVGKTSGADDGTGIAPAAGTGIKNTAATNVVGDFCTLVALDTTTWYMVAVAGVWASQ